MEVSIRPLKIEDAYTSVKWRNDPEVFKYTGNTYDQQITIESELNWIKRVINNIDEYRCAIIVDGEYVGNIYLTNIKQGEAEYHIFIGDKNYWGKGVASAATRLILEYGFTKIGLTRINLNVNRSNISALNLYKNIGFKHVNKHYDEIKEFISMTICKAQYL